MLNYPLQTLFSDFFYTPSPAECYKNRNTIVLELPGVKKENINITLDESGLLKVDWKRNSIDYEQKFYTKDVIDAEANLEDGVLQILLKHKENSKRKIEIK